MGRAKEREKAGAGREIPGTAKEEGWLEAVVTSPDLGGEAGGLEMQAHSPGARSLDWCGQGQSCSSPGFGVGG